MEINLPLLIGNAFVGLVIAVVSARVTVHFALRRFHSEKWWERKADAYSSIIEALHHIRNYADHHMEFEMRGTEMPEDGKRELSKELRRALAELRKRADVGTFVISKEAVAALRTLGNEMDASMNTTSWLEHLDVQLAAVNKCLEAMRSIATKDLTLQ